MRLNCVKFTLDYLLVPSSKLLCVVSLVAFAWLPVVSADEAEKIAFFEKSVRPLLIEHCGECHQQENAEGKLRTDSLEALVRGGSRGPAIVPGKPEESLLIRAIRHDDQLQMPLDKKLATSQIAILAKWVADGAVWPNAPAATKESPLSPTSDIAAFSEEQKHFWSFQRVGRPALPQLKLDSSSESSWVSNPIDAFVFDKLAQAKLKPSLPAERRTWLRRIYLDLIGIPPSPEETESFMQDKAVDSEARVIDRLLASPRYGERWGRHWLDIARYADSNGLDENIAYANAFHYRDYVVSSFNLDRPYDRFVEEQIAGDLLETDASPDNETARIAATGFLCVGAKMLAEDDPMKMQMDIIDEQVDTIGRSMLGLTLGCARCHDHKYDPISMADYYGLAGIFKSTKTMDTFTVVARWHERPLGTRAQVAQIDKLNSEFELLASDVKKIRQAALTELRTQAKQHLGDYLLAAKAFDDLENLKDKLTPIGDAESTRSNTGVILREAEAFDRGTAEIDTTNYGKGIGVLLSRNSPAYAEYDFEVLLSGFYRLEVRYAAANRRACVLMIDGLPVSDSIASGVTGSWQPESQRWDLETIIKLNQGKHILRIERAQTLPHIDKWLLAPVPEAQSIRVDPLDSAYTPVPGFVQQWREYLTKIDSASERPFDRAYLHAIQTDQSTGALREWAATMQQLVNAKDSEANVNQSPAQAALRDSILERLNADNGPLREFKAIENHFSPSFQSQLSELESRRKNVEGLMPKLPSAMAVEEGNIENIRIHFRGSHLTQGAIVQRRFPQLFTGKALAVGDRSSGRLEMAKWLTSRENPLLARVYVNRLWHWHFGAGIVRSPDNFGLLGEAPTHPELLDWLANELVHGDWSTKRLHRLILMSSTSRMASRKNEQAFAIDPENRLWWRIPSKRMEAETIRDSILAVAGRLDLVMGGSLLPTENHKYVSNTGGALDAAAFHNGRRSVYLPAIRSEVYEVLQAFDFADPAVVNGARQSTTVAPQALFMLNSELVAECSKTLAERLLADISADPLQRLERLYLAAYSRPPSKIELEAALNFVKYFEIRWTTQHPDKAREAELRAWQSLCRSVMAANEFVFSM